MNKLGVVIIHYKGEEDTRECLLSLLQSKEILPYKIFLILNSSTKYFENLIDKNYSKIEVIDPGKNTGFAEGVNIGIRSALSSGVKYILLLNNDTIVKSGLMTRLVSYASSYSDIGLVSPKIYFAKGEEYHLSRYERNELGKVFWYAGGIIDWKNIYAFHRGVDEVDRGQYEEVEETDFTTGCGMLINKDVFSKVGFIDEKYYMYFEDVDFSVKVKRAGFKVIYYPGAVLWHKNASSSEKPGSKIHIYYQTRNRLYFGYKYASIRAKNALFWESFKLLFRPGAVREAILDYYLGHMGKGDL